MMYRILLSLMLFTSPILAQDVQTGVATYFDGIGAPYGGCGVPEAIVETSNYVALNVFNTPGSGTQYSRPVSGGDLQFMGEFQNGNNCGRWLKVTILENCLGTNDGALGQPFCRGSNASWVNDQFSGSVLNMIVTDACGDGNGWCRDSPYHLDFHKPALSLFDKDGQPSTAMYPDHFNNRKIQWEYIEAPGYTGDIKIHLMKDAQQYYVPVLFTHLRNGIHSVEQKVGDKWVTLKKNSDMGQSYLLVDFTSPYTVRVKDVNDAYVNKGREYTFDFPSQCGGRCSTPATEVSYTITDPIVTGLNGRKAINGQWQLTALEGSATLSWKNLSADVIKVQVTDLLGRNFGMVEVPNPGSSGQQEIRLSQKGVFKIFVFSENDLLTSEDLMMIR